MSKIVGIDLGTTATGTGGPERPGGTRHSEPRDEDVIEGEYREM